MARTQSKLPTKAPAAPSATRANKKTLAFPSVTTRLPSGRPSADYDKLGIAFPDPSGDGTMDLAQFFGAPAIAEIEKTGRIQFHAVGDTGVGTASQEAVADAMAGDINNTDHAQGPSFMVHLGDVMYGPNKASHYLDRFYRVYDHYDRLVFAVPGNHDGEVFPTTDPVTLAAFKENFCEPVGSQPPLAKSYGMLVPNQPGPYWHLQAPFVDIIGLYSNADENAGIIKNLVVGGTQKAWLEARLTAIAAARKGAGRKALLFAVHHPPYARGFQETVYGHPGNPEMLQDIDDCCAAAGILPDAVIAGHTHSYQHYVRTQTLKGTTCTIPYLIVGTGGISLQKVPGPSGVRNAAGDVLYFSGYQDYGYLTVTASATQLVLLFTAVASGNTQVREQVTVDLATHAIL